MPIDYTCPHCHAKFFVDDAYRGQSGPCAECGKTITIPGRSKTVVTDQKSKEQLEILVRRTRNARILRWSIWGGSVLTAATISYLLAILFIPEIGKLAVQRDANKSLSNLQRIAKALNEYAAKYNSYPPPTVVDATGKPLYSWRVLILPQLGNTNLYSQFSLDKAWDAPENQMLLTQMPDVYHLVGGDQKAGQVGLYGQYETMVSLVTGPGTLFPLNGPLGPSVVRDPASTTLLVTEAIRTNNSWSCPGDCIIAVNTHVGAMPNIDIGSNRSGIALAASVAENPLVISDKISPNKLRGLITPNGGEQIDAMEYHPDQMRYYIKP